LAGIAFGLVTQLFFLYTVWELFWFLRDGRAVESAGFAWRDAALSLQFATIHSALLWPANRSRLKRLLPDALYGCLFCMATCATLITLINCWQISDQAYWQLQGMSAVAMRWAFYGSWIALLYSLSLTGLGYQTGLTQWLHWLRGEKLPRRSFQPSGAYQFFRHPVYLSFLGLIWFTPRMTADHAILTGVWTTYILFGSYLKDRRLEYYLGEAYRAYCRRVPGYPGLTFSPLGKWPNNAASIVSPGPNASATHGSSASADRRL
jgi:protein-S-isoprenylcysteine O-methyltransferase Ste14